MPMIQYLQRKYRNLTGDKGFAEIFTGTAWAMLSRVGTTTTRTQPTHNRRQAPANMKNGET